MGHKGPVLRPRCIGPTRACTQILFYSILFYSTHTHTHTPNSVLVLAFFFIIMCLNVSLMLKPLVVINHKILKMKNEKNLLCRHSDLYLKLAANRMLGKLGGGRGSHMGIK
jgi:hypothetical protein